MTCRIERLCEDDRRDPHLETPLSAFFVLTNCMSLHDPVFAMNDETLPGQEVVFCQACYTACCTEVLKTL